MATAGATRGNSRIGWFPLGSPCPIGVWSVPSWRPEARIPPSHNLTDHLRSAGEHASSLFAAVQAPLKTRSKVAVARDPVGLSVRVQNDARAEMEFRILGPLEVRRDGRALALGGAKQRGLLATLLTQPNKSFAVERLAELLWADDAPATADHAIEVYVSQLRRTLEPDGAPYQILVRSPTGYSLQIDPAAIDAVQFQRLVEGAKRLSPEPAHIELDKALDLWRGPAFADFAGEAFAISEAG